MATELDKALRPGPHAIVTMPAEIDATNAGQIRQALLSAARQGAAVLIIDMSATTFCDSAGVRALVAAHQQALMTGTQLRLAATAVLRILTLTGADQLIPIYPTLDAALAGTTAARPGAHPGDAPDGSLASGSHEDS